ncbi:GBP3-like protein [Mya arenaria]|uniref:GBP3-like protein n=1 Tax=Mya arenaria TaxID=6604 RepID=A0ABY7FJD7_MYAAR|nr:GBP3-like protein [Mya arenaria]
MAEKEHTTDSAAYGDVKSRKSFFESVFSDKSGKLPTRTLQGKNKTSPQTEKGQSHLAGNQSSTVVAKKDRDQGKEELHDQRKDDKVEVEQRLTKTPENRKTRDWFPHNLEVFKKPMCLISTEGENILKVEEETLKQIEKIDLPCCVVVVAGLYRTGKSYLMNRLAEAHSGFALGDTIESKTKGIWVWCKMHPEKKQTVLILLDTEGLGDVKKGDQKHDNRLFTLAALLSSTLVYNMKGTFDQDAVLTTYTSFYQQLSDKEINIIQMDNKLSEDERKKQADNRERTMKSMVEEIKQDNKQLLERLDKVRHAQHKNIQKERKEKFEEENEELKRKSASFTEEERKRLAQLETEKIEIKNMNAWGRFKCLFTGY